MMTNTKPVYITRLSKFLPNKPVMNDDMEDFLGRFKGLKSRSKNIVLRNNGIKSRYYAVDKNGKSTHTNYELTSEAIKALFDEGFSKEDIDLLACGTTSPDQLLPSHASMVHGHLRCNPVEVVSPAGSCNSGMLALKYGYLSVLSGLSRNAVCSGSEKISTWIQSKNFNEEIERYEMIGENPYLAFEKEFLRWMLSDGAAAVLLQDAPNSNKLSLKINCIDIKSYANEAKTCMCAGAILKKDNDIIPWRDLSQAEQMNQSVFTLRQDTKLLEKYITKFGARMLAEISSQRNLDLNDINYFLPHMSSEFFRKIIQKDIREDGLDIPDEKWFTNLHKVGNVGSASAFLMLEELYNSDRLKVGDNILVMVPESARFSYAFLYLTVV